MNASGKIAEQSQLCNWESFCRYHAIGDWHGVWTRYDSDKKIIESFKCIRSFRQNVDSTEVNHENYYTYNEGRKETKTFEPYKKPNVKGIFINNSFSWGSKKVELNSAFGFETGFKFEKKGVSVAVIYDQSSKLQRITVIVENLGDLNHKSNLDLATYDKSEWQGTRFATTPELIKLPSEVTSWRRIEDLGNDYFTLHHSDKLSVSCPQELKIEKEFILIVDWQVNPTLLQRGTRCFDTSGFKSFNLENFSPSS